MSDMIKPNDIIAEAEEAANLAITELSAGELDDCSGGVSGLGDISSLFKGASSFFEQSGIKMDQVSFAGPNGAGSISSLTGFDTASGNSDVISFGL
ncbi:MULTISPECIES: hypothetical protein [unclassified Nodosilinea]|uniref:Uncharacterized protein n=1 Tax=Leptolyngbya subtilissima DQ-A4 TaxID=2933933 RepID=A0ABV0KB51_9CYAN|nr:MULTISPECIES: hypothetical protein [unclassified Nodosilinea]MBD2108803.1 hypothetical protein [Nodosilinea sp. FACHB-13]MBD2110321.1 hypothetical protein [Nodosilinea sp. FACHB-141]